jgi:hypothetical protein
MSPQPTLTAQLESLPEWEGLLNRVGWPILLLFAVGLAAWKVGRFLAPQVERIVNAQVAFIEGLKSKLDAMDGKLSSIDGKVDDLIEQKRGRK